jgi:hypothetical protein
MTDLLRPEDLRSISDDADMAKARELLNREKKREAEQRDIRDAFMQRELHPLVAERVNTAIRRAAEQGHHELQVFTFPASFCNDSGRRINNNEPDWPDSLEGFSKHAYEYYASELRPLGYKLRAQVLDYPGGMLGEIGLFLTW